jgi:hypothetical protein
VNPLYAHLPTTLNIDIEDVSFTMVLSPKSSKVDEDWAHWGDGEHYGSDSEDSDDDDWHDGIGGVANPGPRTSNLEVEPWQTLLLLEDNASENAEKISKLLVGLGVLSGDTTATPGSQVATSSVMTTPADGSRRHSGDTVTEDDEGALMKCLIQACDVTKP